MRAMGRDFSLRIHLRAGDDGGTGLVSWDKFSASLRSLGLRPPDGGGPGDAVFQRSLAARPESRAVALDTSTGQELAATGGAGARAGIVFDASAMAERSRCGAVPPAMHAGLWVNSRV